jgi:hypothetical protein
LLGARDRVDRFNLPVLFGGQVSLGTALFSLFVAVLLAALSFSEKTGRFDAT